VAFIGSEQVSAQQQVRGCGVDSVLPDLGRVTNAVQTELKRFRNLAKRFAVDGAFRTDQRNVKFAHVAS
jgi:hypothetical protein